MLGSGAPVACLVGKTWDFHVETALGVTLAENVAMIGDSIALADRSCERGDVRRRAFLRRLQGQSGLRARLPQGGARRPARAGSCCATPMAAACRTRSSASSARSPRAIPGDRLGIHCHNDTENAVANSLAAVRAGARQVQGTLNGLGERCGNANLVSLIPSLMLKMGFETGVTEDGLRSLTQVSRSLDERLNRPPNRHAPYVGEARLRA